MQVYRYPSPETWPSLVGRPELPVAELEQLVGDVFQAVAHEGDTALLRFTERFDGVQLKRLQVTEEAFAEAEAALPNSLKEAIRTAEHNIRVFHAAQQVNHPMIETMPGVRCWRRSVPIEKVGLYIPGGTAPLFSTVLMLAVPATLAGCQQIVLCTPPQQDRSVHPAILFAASTAGVQQVYTVGGIQAVAAMTLGTASIPAVYKIFGPGNQYVTAAKQHAARKGVAMDLPAGPSEVAVLADHTANPAFIASDLLSQAEHGPDSQVFFVTTEEELLTQVQAALESQLINLPRAEVARQALANSRAVLVRTVDELLALSEAYAPEHLILHLENAEAFAKRIRTAGSVFIGAHTPESVGDYASGTNHTLPTAGFARAYSGVSLESFQKQITFQQLTPEGLALLGPTVIEMAEAERLHAHAQAVRIRLHTNA